MINKPAQQASPLRSARQMTTMTVAKFLAQQIAVSGKSQKDIASACGYTKPNIMTMFKTGATKLPLNVVLSMAQALEVDPVHLLRLAMKEYMPEAWQAIESILGADELTTNNERRLLAVIRRAAGEHELDMTRVDNQHTLANAVQSIVGGDQARAEASVAALNELPRNCRPK